MIVRSISVENLGLFQGLNKFVLWDDTEKQARIAVVAGKNGVGKSTLFRATPFALYGAAAVGDRVSQRDYEAYLRELLHRAISTDGALQRSNRGRVTVEIDYVRSGLPYTATVTREVRAIGSRVVDEVHVEAGDLEVPVLDPQAWINDLLPPTVAEVMLFDAEDLAGLIGGEERAEYLKRTFQRMLGVHLVQRLVEDLNHYLVKTGVKSLEPLRVELLQAKDVAENAQAEVARIEALLADASDEERRAAVALRTLEDHLASEGGAYARVREQNVREVKRLEQRISDIEGFLRQECEGLLPVAASRRMLLSLQGGLEDLDDEKKAVTSAHFLSKVVENIFEDNQFGKALDRVLVSDKSARGELMDAFRSAVQRHIGDPAHLLGKRSSTIHDLSSSEAMQLRTWIAEAGDGYRSTLHMWAKEIGELKAQRDRALYELSRAPEEETLESLHGRIVEAQKTIDDIRHQKEALFRELGETAARAADAERKYERVRKEFEDRQRGVLGADLAINSRNAAAVYQDALIRDKLLELEERILQSFNSVCRKQNLLARVNIDPESFRTILEGPSGQRISLEDFSAGERQLYNLALFKALRDVSGLEMPLFIDTPFARLDETHRQKVMSSLLPSMANQIVLFTTDAEGAALGYSEGLSITPEPYWLELDQGRHASAVSRVPLSQLSTYVRPGDIA